MRIQDMGDGGWVRNLLSAKTGNCRGLRHGARGTGVKKNIERLVNIEPESLVSV